MDIIAFLRDPKLGGASPVFRNLKTWVAWIVFLKAIYGRPLDAHELAIFKRHTGRTKYEPPSGGYSEAVGIDGRQSGKTEISALLTRFEALRTMPDGEVYCLLVAQDHRAAQRTLFRYVTAGFDASDMLRNEVTDRTRDSLTLKSGVRIACYPCRPSAIRGVRARIAVADELAFYRSSEGYPVDTEMLRALRPTLATTNGKLVVISSPYGQSGALWDLHRKHFGRDDSPTLVWQASAPEMNPTLSADYLQRMEAEDPEAYRSEVLGEFRAGLSTLLDPDALDACVAHGRPLELPPQRRAPHRAFCDFSAGRRDAAALAIGFRTTDGRAVVSTLRAWPAPHNPSAVVAEMADVLRTYGVTKVVGDRFSGEWPREAMALQRVRFEQAAKPKSDLYLDLLAYVNSGRVEIPEETNLLRELRGLERRRGSSGRDRVDHAPGAHDDRANAVAGLAHLLLGKRPSLTPEQQGITDLFEYLFSGGRRRFWPRAWPVEWQDSDPRYAPDDYENVDPRFVRIPAEPELGDEGGDY